MNKKVNNGNRPLGEDLLFNISWPLLNNCSQTVKSQHLSDAK